MTFRDGHIRDAARARLRARSLRNLYVRYCDAARAGGRAVRHTRVQGNSIEAAEYAYRRETGQIDNAATAAATRSMTQAECECLRGPGISTHAAARLHRKAALAATRRQHDHRAARAAAAARIIEGARIGSGSVCSECGYSGEAAGSNQDDAAARRTAAGLVIAIGVVARSTATTAAQTDPAQR